MVYYLYNEIIQLRNGMMKSILKIYSIDSGYESDVSTFIFPGGEVSVKIDTVAVTENMRITAHLRDSDGVS